MHRFVALVCVLSSFCISVQAQDASMEEPSTASAQSVATEPWGAATPAVGGPWLFAHRASGRSDSVSSFASKRCLRRPQACRDICDDPRQARSPCPPLLVTSDGR